MSDKKGLFGGLFGGKKEEKPQREPAKKDPIQEAKRRTEELARETAARAEKMEKQRAAAVKKHVVQSGETLSAIAKQHYGDAGKYMKIYEANKDVIGGDPNLIQPGMELVIPKD